MVCPAGSLTFHFACMSCRQQQAEAGETAPMIKATCVTSGRRQGNPHSACKRHASAKMTMYLTVPTTWQEPEANGATHLAYRMPSSVKMPMWARSSPMPLSISAMSSSKKALFW